MLFWLNKQWLQLKEKLLKNINETNIFYKYIAYSFSDTSSNIKHDEINIIIIINDNSYNLHNSLLNNKRYMKATQKS